MRTAARITCIVFGLLLLGAGLTLIILALILIGFSAAAEDGGALVVSSLDMGLAGGALFFAGIVDFISVIYMNRSETREELKPIGIVTTICGGIVPGILLLLLKDEDLQKKSIFKED